VKIELTKEDLDLIEVALRCRYEACDENDDYLSERREGKKFRAAHRKIIEAIDGATPKKTRGAK